MMTQPLHILIVDDHRDIRCGFREVPDSNYGKSRTRISVSPGQGFR